MIVLVRQKTRHEWKAAGQMYLNDVREIVPINLRVTCRHRFQPATCDETSSWQIKARSNSFPRKFYQPNSPCPPPGCPIQSALTYLSRPNAEREQSQSVPSTARRSFSSVKQSDATVDPTRFLAIANHEENRQSGSFRFLLIS